MQAHSDEGSWFLLRRCPLAPVVQAKAWGGSEDGQSIVAGSKEHPRKLTCLNRGWGCLPLWMACPCIEDEPLGLWGRQACFIFDNGKMGEMNEVFSDEDGTSGFLFSSKAFTTTILSFPSPRPFAQQISVWGGQEKLHCCCRLRSECLLPLRTLASHTTLTSDNKAVLPSARIGSGGSQATPHSSSGTPASRARSLLMGAVARLICGNWGKVIKGGGNY